MGTHKRCQVGQHVYVAVQIIVYYSVKASLRTNAYKNKQKGLLIFYEFDTDGLWPPKCVFVATNRLAAQPRQSCNLLHTYGLLCENKSKCCPLIML